MGVKSLTAVLQRYAPQALVQRTIEDYRSKTLAIDASCFLHRFVYGGDTHESRVQQSFYRLCHYLELRDVKPIFVFDGPDRIKEKARTIHRRRWEKERAFQLLMCEQERKQRLDELSVTLQRASPQRLNFLLEDVKAMEDAIVTARDDVLAPFVKEIDVKAAEEVLATAEAMPALSVKEIDAKAAEEVLATTGDIQAPFVREIDVMTTGEVSATAEDIPISVAKEIEVKREPPLAKEFDMKEELVVAEDILPPLPPLLVETKEPIAAQEVPPLPPLFTKIQETPITTEEIASPPTPPPLFVETQEEPVAAKETMPSLQQLQDWEEIVAGDVFTPPTPDVQVKEVPTAMDVETKEEPIFVADTPQPLLQPDTTEVKKEEEVTIVVDIPSPPPAMDVETKEEPIFVADTPQPLLQPDTAEVKKEEEVTIVVDIPSPPPLLDAVGKAEEPIARDVPSPPPRQDITPEEESITMEEQLVPSTKDFVPSPEDSSLKQQFLNAIRMISSAFRSVEEGDNTSSRTQQYLTTLEYQFIMKLAGGAQDSDAIQDSVDEMIASNQYMLDSLEKRAILVTPNLHVETRQFLEALGKPCIVAGDHEAEAVCARLTTLGIADASVTEDLDAVLFGDGLVLRHIWSRTKPVLEINPVVARETLGLSRDSFIDLGILCGTDFSDTIQNIGPVRAVKLIKQHESIESILANIDLDKYRPRDNFTYEAARKVFNTVPTIPTDPTAFDYKLKDAEIEDILERYEIAREEEGILYPGWGPGVDPFTLPGSGWGMGNITGF